MKISTVLFSLLLSVNLFASCPDLQGNYLCEITINGMNYTNEISVTQSGSGSATTYTLLDHLDNTATTVVANGQWSSFSYPDGLVNLKASCQEGALILDGFLKTSDGIDVTFVQENTILNTNQVQIKTTSTYMGYTDVAIEVCTRK